MLHITKLKKVADFVNEALVVKGVSCAIALFSTAIIPSITAKLRQRA